MGKYSGVDVSGLKSAVEVAIQEALNSHNLNDIYELLSRKEKLDSNAVESFKKYIKRIQEDSSLNGSLSNLRDRLSFLYGAANTIEMYQKYEKDIKALEKKLMVKRTSKYQKSDGSWVTEEYEGEDPKVKAEIVALQQKIAVLEADIDRMLTVPSN